MHSESLLNDRSQAHSGPKEDSARQPKKQFRAPVGLTLAVILPLLSKAIETGQPTYLLAARNPLLGYGIKVQ